MFFKKNQTTTEPAAIQAKISSFVTKDTTFEGNIRTDDNIEINGIFIGGIDSSKEIIVLEHGMITGNIKADRVVNEGKINGSITCNTFKGDIKSQTKDKIEAISVTIMGVFEGIIKCEELYVQESGSVKHKVQAKSVEIAGKVNGDIACETLSTTMHAKVTGKLFVNQLQNNGGSIDGFIGKYQDILTDDLQEIEENKTKNDQNSNTLNQNQQEDKSVKNFHQHNKSESKEYA